jgi:peptide/nickel transport system permease protein
VRATVAEAARRLAAVTASAGAVVVLSFVIFRVLPGDPVSGMIRGRAVTAGQVAELRATLGVGRPLPQQFTTYVAGLFRGDLGISYTYHRPVVDVIAERLGPTLLLTGVATVVAAAVGTWAGTHAGWRPGSRWDRIATGVSLTLWSMPAFWLGLVLMVVLAVGVGGVPGLFPTGGIRTPGVPAGTVAGALDVTAHLVLPCLTLVLAQLAQYMLVTRAAVAEQRSRGYLTLARAKGLRDDQVRRRYAVPNALLPALAVVFTNLGSMVAGVIAVETAYWWPAPSSRPTRWPTGRTAWPTLGCGRHDPVGCGRSAAGRRWVRSGRSRRARRRGRT